MTWLKVYRPGCHYPAAMTTFLQQRIADSQHVLAAVSQDRVLLATFDTVAQACLASLRQGGKLLLAGNGGSAADAQHIAAELVGRYGFDRPGLSAIALTTDTSILTAVGNDYGYERIFARQVQSLGRAGDVLVGYSTSGRSPNILAAFAAARELGIVTVAFTGRSGASALAGLCDHVLAIPSDHTPRIQEAHLLLGHSLCERIETDLFT